MATFHEIRGLRKDAGFALIWVLFVVAIMSALSLAFLQKVSIGTAATVTRSSAIQAHYLARAAANHALWRLLNDPGFPASESVYYMHDLGNGRYGYKVRQPTLTKFGTVATVGGAGTTVTKQSYVQYLKPYNIITAYGRSADQIPEYRRLLGATWVDAADTVDIGSDTVSWMVLKGAPQKKEMIMGTLDTANDINLAVWDGTSWGNLIEFTTSSNYSYRCFDIAYENLSGEGLVVGRYAASGDVRYNIWNGNSWVFGTPQIDANLTPGSSLLYIDMASKPNSDEILIALVQFNSDLKVVQWDGSAFNDLGEIDTDMAQNEYGSAEIVYEQQSGDALILWNHKNSSQIYYAVWDGTALSATAQLPDFGSIPYVIRTAADPTSDYIFVAAVDKAKDLNAAVWDGSAWIDSREISRGVRDNAGQVFDVAWEHSGEGVIVAWPPSGGNNVDYFSWRKGTALADPAVQVGPDLQGLPNFIRLHPISGTQKIILLAQIVTNELRYSLWTGSTFLGDPALLLESSLEDTNLPFDIAESGGS